MNKSEIWALFEKIVYFYPNFSADEQKAAAWHDVLEKISYDQALENLKRYVSVPDNRYPPHPGALTMRPGYFPEGNYIPTAEETRRYLEGEQRRIQLLAGRDIPESARERMRQLGYKRYQQQ